MFVNFLNGDIGPPNRVGEVSRTLKMQSALFLTCVYRVFALRSSPNHTAIQCGCPNKTGNRITHAYLERYEGVIRVVKS